MVDSHLSPYAVLLLRVSLGVMFLTHSVILKLMTFTLAGNAEFFASIGLPGWLGYVVFIAEVVGGSMLVLGIQARWVALALLPILAGAVWPMRATAGCSHPRAAAGSTPSILLSWRSCSS